MSTRPELLIFDVDGVLVDVRGSFQQSTLDTVRFFTGRRFRRSDILRWKSRSGFNDDWKLSTTWINELGVAVTYDEVKARFQKFYWGVNGRPGNVRGEKWLLPRACLRRLTRRCELGVFTGRTRNELQHTFDRFRAWPYFRHIVTMDDLESLKPHPEGLLRILAGRPPALALYLGDNVDDALAARAARVPFLGVLPQRSPERRILGPRLRQLGALDILHSAAEVEDWL